MIKVCKVTLNIPSDAVESEAYQQDSVLWYLWRAG